MEKEIKIKFIYHSCYTMEFENYILIFDYFEGDLPKNPKNKKLIFIATHSHYDHFSKKILEIGNPEENIYILSSDIQDLLQKDNIIYLEDKNKDVDISALKFLRNSDNVYFVKPDEVLDIEDFTIKTFGSTDQGISYTLSLEYLTLFYAGDLNNWIWPEDSPEERKEMEEDFLKEIQKIDEGIDIAFFPIDPRLKDNYDKGARLFLELIEPQMIFPLHFKDDCAFTARFYEEYKDKYPTEIREVKNLGDEFIILLDIQD